MFAVSSKVPIFAASPLTIAVAQFDECIRAYVLPSSSDLFGPVESIG